MTATPEDRLQAYDRPAAAREALRAFLADRRGTRAGAATRFRAEGARDVLWGRLLLAAGIPVLAWALLAPAAPRLVAIPGVLVILAGLDRLRVGERDQAHAAWIEGEGGAEPGLEHLLTALLEDAHPAHPVRTSFDVAPAHCPENLVKSAPSASGRQTKAYYLRHDLLFVAALADASLLALEVDTTAKLKGAARMGGRTELRGRLRPAHAWVPEARTLGAFTLEPRRRDEAWELDFRGPVEDLRGVAPFLAALREFLRPGPGGPPC